jgi:hypothetical protein
MKMKTVFSFFFHARPFGGYHGTTGMADRGFRPKQRINVRDSVGKWAVAEIEQD